MPGARPLAITASMPAAVAISAATTLERIPPLDSGEPAWPMCSAASLRKSVTSATCSAPASRRGSAV